MTDPEQFFDDMDENKYGVKTWDKHQKFKSPEDLREWLSEWDRDSSAERADGMKRMSSRFLDALVESTRAEQYLEPPEPEPEPVKKAPRARGKRQAPKPRAERPKAARAGQTARKGRSGRVLDRQGHRHDPRTGRFIKK